jgi:hypothetical protein
MREEAARESLGSVAQKASAGEGEEEMQEEQGGGSAEEVEEDEEEEGGDELAEEVRKGRRVHERAA